MTNLGGTEGSDTVVLKINDVKEAEKTVTIAPRQTETITFCITRDEPGEYAVDVNGLTESFDVLTPPEVPPVKPPVNWPLIGGIIAAVIVIGGLLAYFLWWRRRIA